MRNRCLKTALAVEKQFTQLGSFDSCLVSTVFWFPYSHNGFRNATTPFLRKKFENGDAFKIRTFRPFLVRWIKINENMISQGDDNCGDYGSRCPFRRLWTDGMR